MKKIKQEKGITLIALIITIVVLLIFAVVAIRAVQGNGIIRYAQNARDNYETAKSNEEAQLQSYLDKLNENDTNGYGKVLDSGKCGDDLHWELTEKGILHIYGTGAMYDYVKYSEPSPWYKYRNEPYISDDDANILNPDGTTYLGTTAYYADNPNGYKINKIVIDEGVTYIGNWAFYRVCVDELTIPEGVESTGHFAIRFSPTLKKVNLPDSLVELGDFGISRNQVLTTINFGDGLKRAGTAAFSANNSLTTALLSDSIVSANIQLNESYSNVDYSAQGLFASCESLTSVSLGSLEYIPSRTFLGCSALESIVIPNTVEYIDEYAFANCTNLKTVKFKSGSQCTLIKAKAFINADAIESITGCTALETIENNAFSDMEKLGEFEFNDANVSFQYGMFSSSLLKSANIGPNVSKLSDYMFYKSALEEIYISNNVTEFNAQCLRECSALKNIYYDGTRAEWDAITKGTNWCYLTPDSTYSTIVYFSDGTTDILKNCK